MPVKKLPKPRKVWATSPRWCGGQLHPFVTNHKRYAKWMYPIIVIPTAALKLSAAELKAYITKGIK